LFQGDEDLPPVYNFAAEWEARMGSIIENAYACRRDI
jgi:hypothetical protein